jgi:hypothetical protein
MVGEGEDAKMEFIPLCSKNSAFAYAARRVSEKNQDQAGLMLKTIDDFAYDLCRRDPDTEEFIYNESGQPHRMRFTGDNQRAYEDRVSEYMKSPIGFDIETHICPADRLPAEIPVELHILKGVIFDIPLYDEFEA